jgi:glycosyltransferase involved in cell wall biosynthesis
MESLRDALPESNGDAGKSAGRKMKVATVISTKNRLNELRRCLNSLREQSRIPEELVVVDADSDSEVKKLVEEQQGAFAAVTYLPFPSSLTQARNHGIKNSKSDIVVFLDDDLVLEADFIQEIVRPIETNPKIAGSTGNISNHPRSSGSLKTGLQYFLQLPYDGDGFFRLSGAPTTTCGLAEDREVEFVPGGITAWRRTVFSEFLFDESLPGLGINEDVDFSYRVSRKWKNFYTSKALAAHERPPLDREGTAAYLQRELSSYWYLFLKNQPKTPWHIAAFFWHMLGVFVRFAFRRFLR